jgi:hypothetical protein
MDSKKKMAISENDVSNYINYNGIITYIEHASNEQYNLCTYDLKSKKKQATELSEGFDSYNCKISNGIAYYYTKGKENNGTRDMTLYKAVVGKKPEVIDSFVSEVRRYNDEKGNKRSSSLNFNLYDCFNDNGFYYGKDVNFTDFNITSYYWNKETNYYFYDGKTNNLLNDVENLSGYSGSNGLIENIIGYIKDFDNDKAKYWYNSNMNNSIIECSIKTGDGSYKRGFLIGSKVYEGEIKGVSKDCNLIAYNNKADGPYEDYESYLSYKWGFSEKDFDYESYILNIKSGLNEKISRIGSVLYFDNNNFLYRAYNRDLILNNEVIDYNILQNKCEHNKNISVVVYITNSGLCLYKDNQTNVVSSNASGGHITNCGNVYYVSDNNLYLYINGESNLIVSNVERIYDSSNTIPGYKILR